MKEAIILPGPKVEIHEIPIPEPEPGQKVPEWATNYNGPGDGPLAPAKAGINQGDDIAGIVEKAGTGVAEFKIRDRVGAFHEMQCTGGSYAEYALAPDYTTFHIPDETTFEEAATIPLAAMTAAIAMYHHLKLPPPWTLATATIPLLIYGASSAVGAFAVKLARNSNIHPIIAIAGKGSHYVETLIDRTKGNVVLDYCDGPEAVIKQIRDILRTTVVRHGLDPGIGPQAAPYLQEIVAPGRLVNLVLPSDFDVSPSIKTVTTVGAAHNHGNNRGDCCELAHVLLRYFSRGLRLGTFSSHPFEVRPGGLGAVEQALEDLKDGRASAVKYVFRIADTPGI